MRTFQLRCPEGEVLDDLAEFHVLEVPKVPKEFDGTSKCVWAQFFASKDEEELNLLAEKDPVIRKAVGVIMELSEDELNQMQAEREEDARRVQEDIELFHRNKGREELKSEIKIKMIEKGLDLKTISTILDLSVDEISKVTEN